LKKKLETKIKTLRQTKNITNIDIAKWSMRSFWGGSSLLKVHFGLMRDLLELKSNNVWNWDYFINLSESDFPIKFILF
jgi:protein xylosyltransferase